MSLTSRVLSRGGDDAYGPPVANAPTKDAPRVALGSHLERENLGGIQPWDCQPSGAETHAENERERCSRCTVCCCLVLVNNRGSGETTRQKHGDSHHNGPQVQRLAPPKAIKGENGEQGGELRQVSMDRDAQIRQRPYHVGDIVNAGQPARFLTRVAGLAENVICVC